MFKYTYKYSIDPKKPGRITLKPTFKTYVQAFAPILVLLGGSWLAVMVAEEIETTKAVKDEEDLASKS